MEDFHFLLSLSPFTFSLATWLKHSFLQCSNQAPPCWANSSSSEVNSLKDKPKSGGTSNVWVMIAGVHPRLLLFCNPLRRHNHAAGHHPGDATTLGEWTPPRTGSSNKVVSSRFLVTVEMFIGCLSCQLTGKIFDSSTNLFTNLVIVVIFIGCLSC